MATEGEGSTGGLGVSGVQLRKLTKGATKGCKKRIFPTLRTTLDTAISKSSCLRREKTNTAPAQIPKTTKVYCESFPVSTGWSQVSNISTIGQDIQTRSTRIRASFKILMTTAAATIASAIPSNQPLPLDGTGTRAGCKDHPPEENQIRPARS